MDTNKLLARRGEQRLFLWIAGFVALLVFAGFSRTYFLHSLFGVPGPIFFLHVHSIVMSGWIVLYLVQTALVSSQRTQLHRQLGYFGAGYAVLVVLLGTSATFRSAHRDVAGHSKMAFSTLNVLGLELTQMLLFSVLVGMAVWLRNRPAYHKRLMLLGTLCMLPNPIVRLFFPLGVERNVVFIGIWATLVIAIVVADTIRNKKVHPVFGFGGIAIIVALYLAQFASVTNTWQQFAARVVR